MKLDIRKAFASVNWIFVLTFLEAMEFPARSLGWIKECVSIKINGQLEGFFHDKKDIGRGAPFTLPFCSLPGGFDSIIP